MYNKAKMVRKFFSMNLFHHIFHHSIANNFIDITFSIDGFNNGMKEIKKIL